MKKLALVFMLFFTFFFCEAQNKYNIGLGFETGNCGLSLRTETYCSNIYQGEKYYYSVNGLFDIRLTNKILMSTGISFKNLHQDYIFNKDYLSPESFRNISKFGSDYINDWQNASYSNSYNFITIPLTIKYQLIKINMFSVFVNGGFGANFLFKEKSEVLDVYLSHSEEYKETSKKNKYYFSNSLGIDFNYDIGKRLNIFVEPSSEFFLGKISRETVSINGHFYSLGVKIGVLYRL